MRLAAAGDNCIDNYAAQNQRFAGGNPVNIAVSFVRDGGSASYIGAVGDDDNGSFLRDALAEAEVDVSHTHVLHGATAVTEVELVDGERILGDYDEGVLSEFDLSKNDLDFIAGHDLFVSAWWGNLNHRLRDVQRLGVPVAFDFATEVESAKASETLPGVDYAFFSDERPDDDPDLRALMVNLQRQGPRVVVATLGANGSLALEGNAFVVCPALDCDVVDTMGAGDSYIGGFLAGATRGESIEASMFRATKSAAATLGIFGAW